MTNSHRSALMETMNNHTAPNPLSTLDGHIVCQHDDHRVEVEREVYADGGFDFAMNRHDDEHGFARVQARASTSPDAQYVAISDDCSSHTLFTSVGGFGRTSIHSIDRIEVNSGVVSDRTPYVEFDIRVDGKMRHMVRLMGVELADLQQAIVAAQARASRGH